MFHACFVKLGCFSSLPLSTSNRAVRGVRKLLLLLYELVVTLQDNIAASDYLGRAASTGRLSLCRILVAVTEILDVPRVLQEEAAALCCSLQLQYQLLGQREVICLENPVAQAPAETSRSGELAAGASSAPNRFTHNRADEELGGDNRGGGRGDEAELLETIPVNHLRCVNGGWS